MEDYMVKEKAGREASAAESVRAFSWIAAFWFPPNNLNNHQVSVELLRLLRHAGRRGLAPIDSFRHFDTAGCGYIDADMLVDGNPLTEIMFSALITFSHRPRAARDRSGTNDVC